MSDLRLGNEEAEVSERGGEAVPMSGCCCTIGSVGDGHHERQVIAVRQPPLVAFSNQGVIEVGAVGAASEK